MNERIKQIASAIVHGADAERAAKAHEKTCEFLRSADCNTADGVMGVLGSLVLQVSAQFKIPHHDTELVLCAIMRGPEFKPS